MTNHRPRHQRLAAALAPILLLAACTEPPVSSGADLELRRPAPGTAPVAAALELGLSPLAIDERGVPRLVRVTDDLPAGRAVAAAPAPGLGVTEAALAHLGRISAAWGVAEAAVPALEAIGEVPAPGAAIARVRQTIDGLPVEGGELRVLVRDGGELVAASGALVSTDTPREPADFPIDDAQAIARAVAHNFKRDFAPAGLAMKQRTAAGARLVGGLDGDLDVQLARARQVWHDAGGALIPAWVVEAYAGDARSTSSDAFRTVLTADGRRVLSHRSLVADAGFSYRVFAEPTGELHPLDGPIADSSPHPTGTPDGQFPGYVGSALVSVDGMNHPAGRTTPDPWLPMGRTETIGNNVEAYTDIAPPSGLTFGDFRATVTSAATFDRAYDLAASPLSSQAQQMASITSAFYGLNWLHDFWYDAGFTEAAGNGQDSNYGRGGEDRDAMLAETQDNAPNSLNNANMATPSDGLPPRMQIFVWLGKDERSLTLQPSGRSPPVGAAVFGPFEFDTPAPIVLGVDDTAPLNDGCTPLTNAVAGKLVLVDRGACSFKMKALNIQTAGGAGMILANTTAGVPPPGLGPDPAIATPITIGSLSVTLEEGDRIKAELGAGEVSGVARRKAPLLDGGLDSTLLAHEFGHYLHHRLQDCNTAWCGAISEGWGDFSSLMLMMRDGDNYDGTYPFSVYTTQGFTSDPAYFGIRRAPYSVNPAINSLSYRHMADGVPLPTSHPFLASGVNSEVHNAGEIWAQAMLEVYVALLEAGPSFTEVRAKMARYVVAGLLMAPRDGTPTETRDALLAVAAPEDRDVMLAAFARRGLGSCAVTPARDSQTFVGIVDGLGVSGRAAAGDLGLTVRGCDGDDVLDAGEIGVISLPISNQGHQALEDVKVTVTTATPGITMAHEPIAVGTLAPGASRTLSIEARLDRRVTGPVAGDFTLKIESRNGCAAALELPFLVRLNVDDVSAASSTDAFDARSVWQPSDAKVWAQVTETALDRRWHGADVAGVTDTRLESPAVAVGTGPFQITFTHRFKLEYSDGVAWDGGVVEISIDGGATWQDVSALPGVAPGYSYVLATSSYNPLGGRPAYGNQNPSYPEMDDVTLDFGTELAGKRVKLRFRLGSDQAVGAPGWDIDDVVFQGITDRPFPMQVGNPTECTIGVPGGEDPAGCCDAGPIRGGNLALALGGLAILLRRRRR